MSVSLGRFLQIKNSERKLLKSHSVVALVTWWKARSMATAEMMQTNGADVQPANAGIRDGDTVILDVNGEKQAFVTIKRNRFEWISLSVCFIV